jgi:3-methyladenine DNA glycosylase AlkD
MNAALIQTRIRKLGNRKDAKILQWFFKTGPGEYGEGDVFVGVRVPLLRQLKKEFMLADEATLDALLESAVHEDRLMALIILVGQFEKGSEADRKRLYRFYLAHTVRINNWDLVDVSAPQVVGGYLAGRSRRPLYRLAASRSLWERRVSILATFTFIRQGDYADALALADRLLHDREDLMHKAVGWMLREIGKRDLAVLEAFLKPRCRTIPRTMLRYAIEKFPEAKRQAYLSHPAVRPLEALEPRLAGRRISRS